MQFNVPNSTPHELDSSVNDLGPLAWVLDELHKSLEGAAKALKRFVREAEAARGSDLASLDAGQLRIARQQLHQAVGALEMVGLPGPALVLRAMEAAVQKFLQQPEHCNQDAAARIERASFALTEYLEGVLAGRPVYAVSLFPQYRDVLELVRADRIHPADLWSLEWRWLEPALTMTAEPLRYDDSARAVLDQSVLPLMKGKAPEAAQNLKSLSLGLSAGQTERQPRIFWIIAAAYFEAVAHDLLNSDLYVRRATSRVLMQYASLSKGDTAISERLAQDLLFFCAQAAPGLASDTPVLAAVRLTYGLDQFKPVDYELVQFGRFDPALLAQARKRITSAKELWSSLSAGDASKLKPVADQFNLVAESLLKLHPPSEPLAQALCRAVDTTLRAGQSPRVELAMELATSVLYLEAVFADLDPNDPQLAERTASLAERLEGVRAGGEPQPLEVWMEELYRRVSDKQTMGSVVGELRVGLGELEKSLDLFFRSPQDKSSLSAVPGQLSQMRGVLSLLGLDQASHAVSRMKDSVEQMLVSDIDETQMRAAGTFDRIGNNLGALSFLIDMLNYQPVLAKKLFVYDEEKGELKLLMGRAKNMATAAAETGNSHLLPQEVISLLEQTDLASLAESVHGKPDALATQAGLDDEFALLQARPEAVVEATANRDEAVKNPPASSPLVPVPAVVAQVVSQDFEEEDLRDIFLEEAREVVGTAQEALSELKSDPEDAGQLTILRRAFHTLKGSARMVGLGEFGEAAWGLEQLLNTWLAEQKSVTDDFCALNTEAMAGFSRWIEAISSRQDGGWSASPFCNSAEAMRTGGRYSPLHEAAAEALSVLPGTLEATGVSDEFDALELRADAEEQDSGHAVLSVETAFEPDPAAGFVVEAGLAAQPLGMQDFADAGETETEGLSALTDASLEPVVVPDLAMATNEADTFSDALASSEMVELSAADFDRNFQPEPVDLAFFPPEMPAPNESEPIEMPDSFDAAQPPEQDVAEPSSVQTAMDIASLGDMPEPDLREESQEDEQVRWIGSLRIGIPLYNVYLNEADEWSRRLVAEVGEWVIERDRPVSDSTVALAHSLAGSSATVGFSALSVMARALEQALQKSMDHNHRDGAVQYGQVFIDAAEDIRRLLHQFAAGFLRQPDADLLERLNQLEFPDTTLSPVSDFGAFDFPGQRGEPEAEVETSPAALLGAEIPSEAVLRAEPSPALLIVLPVREPSFPEVVGTGLPRDADDEIDAVDDIDPDLFPIFEEEGDELMPQLGGALRQWSSRPDNQGARMEVLRVLHTLKGSARLAGALRLGEMAHRMESDIESVGSEAAHTQKFETLLTSFDAMQATFESLRHADNVAALEPLWAGERANAGPLTGSVAASEPSPENQHVQADGAAPREESGRKLAIPAPQAMVMQPLRQAASTTIRVRSHLLERMVNQAGEVMMTRARLQAEIGQLRGSLNDMTGNLNRLRQQLRDIELQAESQMQSRLAQAKEVQVGFDPLEFDRFTRVQELTRMMAESVNDVATVQRTLQRTVETTEDDLIAQARQTRELQRDLLRTRMVEFEGISERLYRVVRQASKDTGKQVRLDLLGGTIEMDRATLDRLTPAFEHLLRNCVAHGIEGPQVRADAGKDPVGLITVHLRQIGNDVSVDFSDDGAGLDLFAIRQKALSLGLVTAEQSLNDQEAASLIFTPGFSTATQITEIAGRGIGMDVVRAEVNALGGRIETSTLSGKGTHIKLVLPLTTAVTQVVMMRAGSLSVGVPANVVENVRRVSTRELQQAYNSGTFEVGGESMPFFWSGALLQSSPHSQEAQAKSTPVVIFRSAAQRIALHVDEVLGTREVVVKNLGPQLSRLPGLAGMSVLASGAVALIYNPVALAAVYGQQASAWSADRAQPKVLEASSGRGAREAALASAAQQVPLILVVDDSITVRRVTQRLLQREGYRVVMAADGLQALERLQGELPAMVLSDIEMPRMDGFDLARNIRADERLRHLPIVMITSRIAEKHREHAKALGVDHYLGKPYSEEALMGLVRHYCVTAITTLE
ncbi:MAG: Hpt domain-containing protein [Polaromonas sp.]|nr:Hpt domain-containing protein [Polaromonas sp.]